MKSKLILFDWGNIVESHQTGYTCHDAFNDTFIKCGYNNEKNIFYKLGKYKISTIKSQEEFKKIYNKIKEDFNLNKSFEEFKSIYKDTFNKIDYYKDVRDFEISLKDKCYIGIFSNLTIFDKERLDKEVNLSLYDYVFLSFEMGLQKPNIDAFKYVENNIPFKGKDILFIDDRLDNIKTAKSLGWNAYQLTGLELEKIKEVCNNFIKRKY